MEMNLYLPALCVSIHDHDFKSLNKYICIILDLLSMRVNGSVVNESQFHQLVTETVSATSRASNSYVVLQSLLLRLCQIYLTAQCKDLTIKYQLVHCAAAFTGLKTPLRANKYYFDKFAHVTNKMGLDARNFDSIRDVLLSTIPLYLEKVYGH